MFISLFMGTVGFLCYYFYDFNSIKNPQGIGRYFFGIGSLCVGISLIYEIYTQHSSMNTHNLWFYVFLCLGILCFGLLIYTLFFCFDAQETYIHVNQKRMAYTKGMYALCRHPGVIWFVLGFFCLYAMMPTTHVLLYVSLMSIYNIIYIIIQDIYIFPETFYNYQEYKQQTPFLIPNIKSIKQCIQTL